VNQDLLIAGAAITAWHANSGATAVNAVLDALALAEPGDATGFHELLEQAHVAQSSLSRVVLVTTRPPGALSEEVAEFERLQGVEIFHATPKQLAPWFTLDATGMATQTGRRRGRNGEDASNGESTGRGDSDQPDRQVEGQLVALPKTAKSQPILREELS
jgi:hypothetical protein